MNCFVLTAAMLEGTPLSVVQSGNAVKLVWDGGGIIPFDLHHTASDTVHSISTVTIADAIIADVTVWKKAQGEGGEFEYTRTSPDIVVGSDEVTIDMTGFEEGDYEVRCLTRAGHGYSKTVIADPAYEMPDQMEGYGIGKQLTDTDNTISFPVRAWKIKGCRIVSLSADSNVTGNVVIVPSVDGTDLDPVVIPVKAEPTEFFFPLDATGMLSLRRDTASEHDTLKDGSVVGMFITNIEFEK